MLSKITPEDIAFQIGTVVITYEIEGGIMGCFKIGDIVARKSYGCDVFFKIVGIRNNGKENIVTLKGVAYRLQADAPESDLVLQSEQSVDEHIRKSCSI